MTPEEVQRMIDENRPKMLAQLAACFAEWDRRCRLEPERFDLEYQSHMTTGEYGAAAAGYFRQLLDEHRAGKF